jgi:hypothetical protein
LAVTHLHDGQQNRTPILNNMIAILIHILLSTIDRITGALCRPFAREPKLSQAEVDAILEIKIVEITEQVGGRFGEALADARAKLQDTMAEYAAAKARLDAETEAYRVLVNMGVAKVQTRYKLFCDRN